VSKSSDFSYLPFFEREVPEGGRVKVINAILIDAVSLLQFVRVFATVPLSEPRLYQIKGFIRVSVLSVYLLHSGPD
jgi:hypothetical protein